jgi:DNA-binding CsgD family transcriptional regulator
LRDVSASTRRVVARDLALLDANVRLLLQICALADEPIEPTLLQQFWSHGELLAMIEQVSGRYLVSDADGLRFVHATIMESVLETIPIEIPLRYRIIDALRRLPSPRIEDYERLAKQCAACGDRPAEREALIRLSDEAAAKSMISLSASALERALAIAPPQRDDVIATYGRLSQMYNALSFENDAVTVARRGLAQAEAAGITEGLGSLVASVLLGLWHAGLTSEARTAFMRYEQMLPAAADRANLFSLGEYMAMHCFDPDGMRVNSEGYDVHAQQAPLVVAVRHEVTLAFFAMRTGDEPTAQEHLRRAESLAQTGPPLFATMPLAAGLLHALRYRGTDAAQQYIAQLGHDMKLPIATSVNCHVMIARGELNDVEEVVDEHLPSSSDSLMHRLFIASRHTASALRGVDARSSAWNLGQRDLAAFELGERNLYAFPVVVASLVPLISLSRQRAAKLLHEALEVAGKPVDVSIFVYPLLLSYAARDLSDRRALDAIASGSLWTDRQPWNLAHYELARGIAAHALGREDHRAFLESSRDRFAALRATYFAALAADELGKRKSAARGTKARPNNTTRRECEIAALVADGLTNREIAERLVLSERTVEGHIANLFAKVNVNSRTQLATWYMRSISSVA